MKFTTKYSNYISILLLITSVSSFYLLSSISTPIRWIIFVLLAISSILSFVFVSPTGVALQRYFSDVWKELQKVDWASKKEVTQFLWLISIFVIILSLLLWGVDSLATWLIYKIILGIKS